MEAHVYPGGCAAHFTIRGIALTRARLRGRIRPVGRDERLGEALGITWPVEHAEAALAVHLPDGETITRWTDPARWRDERLAAFGAAAEPFWRWQEQTADRLWALTDRGVPWPPQGAAEAVRPAAGLSSPRPPQTAFLLWLWTLSGRSPAICRGAPGDVAALHRRPTAHLGAGDERAGQRADGAAALDMPRRGVAHVRRHGPHRRIAGRSGTPTRRSGALSPARDACQPAGRRSLHRGNGETGRASPPTQ